MNDFITSQFIGQSIHFGINLFTALTCIAGGWLYLDAWSERRHFSELAKGLGFMLLAAAFIVTGATWDDAGVLGLIAVTLKLLGYGGLLHGLFVQPVQPRPKIQGYTPAPALLVINTARLSAGISLLLPVLALCVSLMYWRLSTRGLERHLRPLAITFSIFTLSEALSLTTVWRTSANPLLQPLAAPLGLFWIIGHLLLLLGTVFLARWVWRYLAKRLLSQLFLTVTSLTFGLVLFATVSVAGLLLSSLQHDALGNLETATKVLDYAIDSKTAATRTEAEILAQNPSVVAATDTHNQAALAQQADALLVQKQLSEVIITDDTGVVLARGSDPERYGDSLSADSLVQHALTGATVSSIVSRSGALSPTLMITTASPIRAGNDQIIGLALTSLALDNAFVDGVKHKTGLDSTVYSGNVRAATTIAAAGTTNRSLGIKETNTGATRTTLQQGQIWHGITVLSGQAYLAVYLPLKNIDNTVVGMLFVGQPQDTMLATARQAIRLTFAGAALALLAVMAPVYIIARQIARQLH